MKAAAYCLFVAAGMLFLFAAMVRTPHAPGGNGARLQSWSLAGLAYVTILFASIMAYMR